MIEFIDRLFNSLPVGYRSLAAIMLLLLLLFSIWRLLKGYGFFIIVILILVPGVWPALKVISKDFLILLGYTLYRI